MTKLAQFERMGGRDSLIKINKVFYDKVYQHAWLKEYFIKIPQQHIEDQQIDFMQKVLGGNNVYVGKTPPATHNHMFIPDELFNIRKQLLIEAFEETQADAILIEKWLALDESFRRLIVNKSPNECSPRFTTDPILNFPKPLLKK
ncbi:MAG: group 1 truncated hemoglobin [Colwellia sp.]|nr:group 1 truncated hemoglobin [Colwellia sp.]